jgi:hypothetical protein
MLAIQVRQRISMPWLVKITSIPSFTVSLGICLAVGSSEATEVWKKSPNDLMDVITLVEGHLRVRASTNV